MPHKVLIVGAGLGGLVLAQSLRKQGIDFEIFERDENAAARSQGWLISLHWILPHLAKALPEDMTPTLEEAASISHSSLASGPDMYDGYTGECKKKLPMKVMFANRSKLRTWLCQKINVQFGKRFVRYEEDKSKDQPITVFFEDGSQAKGTILIGADGVHSPVRDQLFFPVKVTPSPLPISYNIGIVKMDKRLLDLQVEMGVVAWMALGDGLRLVFTLIEVEKDEQSALGAFFLTWKEEEPQKETITLETLREKVKDLHPRFKRFFEYLNEENCELIDWKIRDLIPPRLPSGNVTLLGDAIHPMSTFRAEGGNNAMLDGVKLGELIGENLSKGDFTDVMDIYQTEMIERATKSVLESRKASQDFHAPTEVWRKMFS